MAKIIPEPTYKYYVVYTRTVGGSGGRIWGFESIYLSHRGDVTEETIKLWQMEIYFRDSTIMSWQRMHEVKGD